MAENYHLVGKTFLEKASAEGNFHPQIQKKNG